MEVFESTPYVKERAKRLAPYFAKRNWFVTAGKNNSILINMMEEETPSYEIETLAEVISESDLHVLETGLRTNDIKYSFYRNGKPYISFTIYDIREFDVWDEQG